MMLRSPLKRELCICRRVSPYDNIWNTVGTLNCPSTKKFALGQKTEQIMAANPCWSVAVFAHNEAQQIRGTLESIEAAAAGHPLEITVLANGCKDATGNVVRDYAKGRVHIRLIEIDLADKANAWNAYVHQPLTSDRCAEIRVHFFVDGDVRIGYKAFPELATALDEVPSANAAGGMPISGRDQESWRVRMVSQGLLAGGFYALRGSFVDRIHKQRIYMPLGFIGEDWLISYLANTNLGIGSLTQAPLVVFSTSAGFSFRSLNPLYPLESTASSCSSLNALLIAPKTNCKSWINYFWFEVCGGIFWIKFILSLID